MKSVKVSRRQAIAAVALYLVAATSLSVRVAVDTVSCYFVLFCVTALFLFAAGAITEIED